MYAIPPPHNAWTPKTQDLHQSLHNIISDAAYLSLCIRLSPTIFYFTPLSPNEAFNHDDQHCLKPKSFAESKEKVVKDYENFLKLWNAKKTELEKHVADLKAKEQARVDTAKQAEAKAAAAEAQKSKAQKGKKVKQPETKTTREAEAQAREIYQSIRRSQILHGAQDELEEHKTDPRHYGFTYRAMSKICAWPNIRRFKPGSEEEEKDCHLELDIMTGCRIHEICKSAEVFCFRTDNGEEMDRLEDCLKGLVKEKQRQYGASRERVWVKVRGRR